MLEVQLNSMGSMMAEALDPSMAPSIRVLLTMAVHLCYPHLRPVSLLHTPSLHKPCEIAAAAVANDLGSKQRKRVARGLLVIRG